MPLIDCLTKAADIIDSKVKDKMLRQHADLIANGMDERQAGQQVINDFAKGYGNKLNDELNKLRKTVGLEQKEAAISTRGNAEEINKKYEPQQQEPPVEPPKEVKAEEAPMTGIKHEATEEKRKEYGLGEYERNNATDAELEAQAGEAIKKGYNAEKLVSKLEGGTPPTGVENFILKKYLAGLEAEFEKNKTEGSLNKVERVYKALDKIGSLQSEAFRTRKGLVPTDDTLAGFFMHEKEVNNDAPLTEKQKETAEHDYNRFQEAKAKFEEDRRKFEEEVAKFRAEQELAKNKKSTKKNTKKTHEDFVTERKDIKERIKAAKEKHEAELEEQGIHKMGVSFTLTGEMVKEIKNLVQSYVEEGLVKLEEITQKVHDEIKDVLEGVTQKDIHNIIAGEYNEKKKITKKEAVIQMENLRQQAALINKLEAAMRNEPKAEKEKVKKNQTIQAFKKQLGIDELDRLNAIKNRNISETERIKEKINKGDFAPDQKRTPLLEDKELQKKFPELYKQVVRARDELIKTKKEIELRRLKQEFENKTPQQKFQNTAVQVFNVPRTVMASMDLSAPLRQAAVATASHPILASKAGKFMLQAAKDEKIYNRWLDDVHNSPRWQVAEKSKLAVTDPSTLHLKEKEEAFLGSGLAEQIPVAGGLIKGSERAYVGFLNKMRWDLFNMYADAFEAKGKTYENSPELYNGLASFVNASTGRGNMAFLEAAAPVANSFLFSPRLIASRMNMLGLTDIPNAVVRGLTFGKRGVNYGFYTKLPKEIRVAAAKDMLKFIAVGLTTLGLAKAASVASGGDIEVEADPRSTDFGKIKSGNTRWDIWGGFQPYARLLAQVLSGTTKSSSSGKISTLDGKGAYGKTEGDVLETFGRGKLAPIPAAVWDVLSKRTTIGEKVNRTFDNPFSSADDPESGITLTDETLQHIIPLLFQDVGDAMKDKGISALFSAGIPSTFGVGVQTYPPYQSHAQEKQPTLSHSTGHTSGRNLNHSR